MTKEYVYFVACKDPDYRIANPHMKIGYTTDLEGRLKSIQTGSPVELCFMAYIRSDDAKALERYFHKIFRKDRKHGEWFDVTYAMINKIKCYPLIDSIFDEFFINPNKGSPSPEVQELQMEISKLRKVIEIKDKLLHDKGIEYVTPIAYHKHNTEREWGKFRRKCNKL